jgi:tetratricopeptide (TPR) repeat protein
VTLTPSEPFVHSVAANVDYWRQHTRQLAERDFGAFDSDWPNLARAIQFGLALPLTWQPTAELAVWLFDFVERRGYWREWICVLEQLLERCPDEQLRQRGLLLNQWGNFLRLDRRLPEAIQAHRQAEAIMCELPDSYQTALMRYALSEDYRHRRQYTEAECWGLAALDDLERLGLATSANAGIALNTLGLIAYARGELRTAEERLARTVEIWRGENAPTELARFLNNLAIVLQAAGKSELALQAYQEAATLAAQTQSEFDKVMVELSLGTLYFELGQLPEAEAAFQRADSPFLRQSGHLYSQAVVANNQGNVWLAQGRLEEAEARLRRSIQLWRQVDDLLQLANSLGTLGEALAKQARVELAAQAYDEALDLLARFSEEAWAGKLRAKFTAQRNQLEGHT